MDENKTETMTVNEIVNAIDNKLLLHILSSAQNIISARIDLSINIKSGDIGILSLDSSEDRRIAVYFGKGKLLSFENTGEEFQRSIKILKCELANSDIE